MQHADWIEYCAAADLEELARINPASPLVRRLRLAERITATDAEPVDYASAYRRAIAHVTLRPTGLGWELTTPRDPLLGDLHLRAIEYHQDKAHACRLRDHALNLMIERFAIHQRDESEQRT